MKAFLTDIRQTVAPDRSSTYGPLPPLLLSMTVVTGLVDAFSYLVLGHVFVANMTGNVVFLAFALVGAHGFSIPASCAALASFGVGAAVGGGVGARRAHHRGHLLSACTTLQAVFLAGAVVLAMTAGQVVTAGFRYGLIAVLGVSMGIQNAAARRLAVPDLTTTVLTQTITGMAADGALAGGTGSRTGRRGLTVIAMFVGALVGAAFIVHAQKVYPVGLALTMTAVVAVVTRVAGNRRPAWTRVD